ncbi:MAG: Uma2 family endonuclease [Acidobacteriota bacterium]|nr:Uma2 family endonuclease [Acidobacteriota bacterium]
MTTLLLDPVAEAMLKEQRRRSGLDRFDEVCWQKLGFYAVHGVDELLIVDPQEHALHWLALEAGRYAPIERSGLIELGASELDARLDWPG